MYIKLNLLLVLVDCCVFYDMALGKDEPAATVADSTKTTTNFQRLHQEMPPKQYIPLAIAKLVHSKICHGWGNINVGGEWARRNKAA